METSGSPTKRTRLTPPASTVATSVADVILSEPALLETIVGFIPQEETETSVSKAHTVLTTIASLCCAMPALGRLVGPSNERLWRSLVLSHFDFSLEFDSHNIEDICEMSTEVDYPSAYYYGEEKKDTGYWKEWRMENPEKWQAWYTSPARAAMLAWEEPNPNTYPEWFFEENYMRWEKLDVLFRPSQYGFLHKIQQDQKLADTHEWPEHEQAFSLFCDLVTLQKIVRKDDKHAYRTFSDGDEFVRPCLLSAMDCEIDDGGYELFQHCGMFPHYWFVPDIVSARWSGLDGAAPGDLEQADEDDDYYPEIKEECVLFPTCRPRDFVNLRRVVYGACDDWRTLCTVHDVGSGPIFHIGRSKTSGRWLGLTGECQC